MAESKDAKSGCRHRCVRRGHQPERMIFGQIQYSAARALIRMMKKAKEMMVMKMKKNWKTLLKKRLRVKGKKERR